MRGKLYYTSILLAAQGITPADAGKTLNVPVVPCKLGDHPRGCGENLSALFLMTACTGSPPRMRGKLNGTAKE